MIELPSTDPNKLMDATGKLRSRMSKITNPATRLLSRESSATQSSSSSSHEPVQVEPKTYFANERTFIQWISAALLLLTVSSVMMGSGGYNATSSVIAFASLVLVAYATFVYFRRVNLLRSGNGYGYLDFFGPTILAAGVGAGVFIVFADAVKGSEFLPWGNYDGNERDDNGKRFLLSSSSALPEKMLRPTAVREDAFSELREVKGKCSRSSLEGINLLEYQPRDIVMSGVGTGQQLIVATPQALVTHHFPSSGGGATSSSSAFLLSELPDLDIQSVVTAVNGTIFALSTGPSKTELIEFDYDASGAYNIVSRFLIREATSTAGSMVFVPSSPSVPEDEEEEGTFYIYLDGTMHSYRVHPKIDSSSSSSSSSASSSSSLSLSRTGTINMKVLNRGGLFADDDSSITAMEHFEGVTYAMRGRQQNSMIEAWDFGSATLLAEMPLPTVPTKNDKWVGMAFQRRSSSAGEDDEGGEGEGSSALLRDRKVASKDASSSSVYLHMPLDAYPPQLWSFRLLEEEKTYEEERSTFAFPECGGGAAMN